MVQIDSPKLDRLRPLGVRGNGCPKIRVKENPWEEGRGEDLKLFPPFLRQRNGEKGQNQRIKSGAGTVGAHASPKRIGGEKEGSPLGSQGEGSSRGKRES